MSRTIALLGQPNSGKSTVFNGLTGAHQHVGNWPGKTVERKEGNFTYQGEAIMSLICRAAIVCQPDLRKRKSRRTLSGPELRIWLRFS